MKYFGYYNCESNGIEKRNSVLSASNKMTYIAETLHKNGIPIEIISKSEAVGNVSYPSKVHSLKSGVIVKFFASKGSSNKFMRVLCRGVFNICFFSYCLLNIRKNETVIVYHSLGYMNMFSILRRLKRFRLVLELEEIYGDVTNNSFVSEKETSFARKADAYIFPTELLNKKVNDNNKPYTVIHGTYQVEEARGDKKDYRDKHGWNNNQIHVVYAGTFDSHKGGALAAIDAAQYLSENYHLHIIGFGNDSDKKRVIQSIEKVKQTAACTVSFDGLLSGEDYICFLQACDIGLSTQNPNATYNDTSFPSKILSYMANGLNVVSINIPVVEASSIGSLVSFYHEQNPLQIAEAIQKVKVVEDIRYKIRLLNEEFSNNISQMIKSIMDMKED